MVHCKNEHIYHHHVLTIAVHPTESVDVLTCHVVNLASIPTMVDAKAQIPVLACHAGVKFQVMLCQT